MLDTKKRAVQCVDARIGIISNNEELIRNPRYFDSTLVESLRTNVLEYRETEYANLDAEFVVIDDPSAQSSISIGPETCFCSGDFTKYENQCKDIRYSLFGNLGLFFRYSMSVLERKHRIYSFHASSLFVPSSNTLVLVVGGAGAGKTVYLLKGLLEDWQVFSTEMTHFRIVDDNVEFYKGSLYDNVRLGSLLYDFPNAVDKLGIELPESENPWNDQIAIDLSSIQAEDKYVNPKVLILNVRIESGRKEAIISQIGEEQKILFHLFKNAGEKFAYPWLMYEHIPVQGCDDEELAQKRLDALRLFLKKGNLSSVNNILAGVGSCLDGLDL